MVKLQNKTEETIKTRVIERVSAGKEKFYRWATIKPGEEIDVEPADERQLLDKGLSLVKKEKPQQKGSSKPTKKGSTAKEPEADEKEPVEDAQDDKEELFRKELKAIKGIGDKTATDILAVYSSKEELLKAIEKKEHIPVEDNVEELLVEHYSQKRE
jgi:hypothetical protein